MNKNSPIDSERLVTDPDQQPGVVLEVPEGITPLGLAEDGYYSDKMVRCTFCKQRQKHRKGFYAILPGGTKALCGHCCAVKLTSKATVAKIERNTELKIKVAKQHQISEALLRDVDELTDLLKSNFIPTEEDIEKNFEALTYIFPSQILRLESKLGYALGGFRSIANACQGKLTEARIEQLLKKRQKSMQAVGLALEAMEKAVSMLEFKQLSRQIKSWAHADNYDCDDVSFNNGQLVAGKFQTYDDEYGFWEKTVDLCFVEMPDTSRVREIIAGSRNSSVLE